MLSILLLSLSLSAPSSAIPPTPSEPPLSQEEQGVKADLGLSVNALVSALPSCELSPGDGALDLIEGCVDGVCTSDPVVEVIRILDVPCEAPTLSADGQQLCRSEDGISFFDATTAETRKSTVPRAFYLSSKYEGRSDSGLGMGVSLSCFLEAYGTPDKVEIEREGDRFAITELRFKDPKVWVQASDGLADRIVVYGPKQD